ncbi:MAG: ABC transporter permease, partial [Spirosomaceae bacterium]|nr:ABC transporter permease [Spirosomataceae bacterium]
ISLINDIDNHLFLPNFNTIVDRNLAVDLFDPPLVGVIIGFTLLVGIVSGLYPALFMSSFRPISVLTGSLKTKVQTQFVRKGLVVFQFCLSIALILGMLVIYQQRDYIMNKNLGFDKSNLIYLPIEGDLQDNFESFKQVLQNAPGIQSVGASNSTPLAVGSATQGISWATKDTTEKVLFSQTAISHSYLKTMDISLVSGRNFDINFGADTANFLINETAAKKMGFEDPIGQQINLMGAEGQIIGVVKDYHVSSLRNAISPLVLWLYPPQSYWGNVLIRTQPGQTKQALASLSKTFKEFNPSYPLQYKFADEEYAQVYKAEQLLGTLANYFAALAIFISCLGLFGLSAFMAEQRTKEIGIRKVLGANIDSLILLLSKEYIYLILIASVIALPTAYYFLQDWLAGFKFRVSIEWWYLALSALVATVIALATVGYQAVVAATADPVKSLKNQ